jgi:alpha-L-fucosidase 2
MFHTLPDKEFLEEIYPILFEAAEFMKGFLVEDKNGELLTAPSVSPENKFIIPDVENYEDIIGNINPDNRFSPNLSYISAVSKGSTMDMTIIRELFENVIEASEMLAIHSKGCDALKAIIDKLPPYKIGKYGQLQEWYEDYAECTPGMGHVSHLYGIYPANIIMKENNEEAFIGAKKSLIRRIMHGGMTGGWPASWAISLAARLKEPLLCEMILKNIGKDLGANMLTEGSVQIDCIFGWGASIAEMLLQSHKGYIEIIPCIPYGWNEGKFEGLRARGGFEVSAQWENGKVVSAGIKSVSGKKCALKAKGLKKVESANRHIIVSEDSYVDFDTVKGEELSLIFA